MIAFDLFGVVFTEGHMVSATLMPLLPNGTDKKLVKQYYHQYTNGESSEQAFWRGIEQKSNTQLRDAFLNAFVLDDDLTIVVDTLSKHYELSILSNLAVDWGDFLIDKFDFESDFNPIIISGRESVGKPDKRIYQSLIKHSQLNANKIAFIDDRLENLATAHELGMQTIHYKCEPDSFDYEADYQISQLKEILAIF